MSQTPKSHGLTYLRYALAKQSKKLNYISIPVDKAREILEVANGFQPSQGGEYSSRSNSVKGAAVVLAMDLKELISRLNAPHPAQLLNDLAEAKNKIKMLQESGDNLVHKKLSNESIKDWVRTKSL